MLRPLLSDVTSKSLTWCFSNISVNLPSYTLSAYNILSKQPCPWPVIKYYLILTNESMVKTTLNGKAYISFYAFYWYNRNGICVSHYDAIVWSTCGRNWIYKSIYLLLLYLTSTIGDNLKSTLNCGSLQSE